MTGNTRRRVRIAAASTAAVAAALIAGCSSGPSGTGGASAGRTTVTFDYLWTGAEAQALQGIISEFNASQDKITVVGVSSPDVQKQLASMSSSNGAFDISDNFGNAVGSWASKGIIAPLDDYIKADGMDTSDFVKAAMSQVTYDGNIYSLPIAVHDFELLYNKKEFAAAGISSPPTTTEDLAADIGKLTKTDSSGNITQLGLGDPNAANTLVTLGYAFGGTWDGTDGRTPSPQDPGNLAALKFYQQNITDKYGAAKVQKFTAGWGQYMSAQDPFYAGKVAMVIDGEWQAVNIPKTAPNLDWGVVNIPVPAAQPSLAGATQLSASTLFIPSNAKHKKEAFEFMKYLTGPKGMAAFTKALGNLPARTSLLDSSAYNSITNFSVWLQNLKSPNVQSLSSQPYGQQYATDLTNAFTSMMDGSASPQAAMASVASRAGSYGS